MSDTSEGIVARVIEFIRSLPTVVQIALNNGLASFYASIFILAVGLCCVRGLWERIGLNGARSDVLHQLMQAPQEPLRPDTAPMLSSAVLGKDIATWELCGDSDGKQLDKTIGKAEGEFWKAYDASLKQGAVPASDPVPIQQTNIDGLHPALTDAKDTLSPLTLPSALFEYWPRGGAPDPAQLAARVQASQDGLEATRSMLASVQPSLRTASLIRFFFISVDGFMRYTASPLDKREANPLPPHRTFNHPSYVLETLSGNGPREGSKHPCGTAYESVPYFDILGGGVVMTTCRRIPAQVSASSFAQGVLCADIALPRSKLIETITHNPLISPDFFVFSVTTKISGSIKASPIRVLERCTRDNNGKISCEDADLITADSGVQERVQKWLLTLQTPRASGYAGASPLPRIEGDDSYDYAAVLWHTNETSGTLSSENFGLTLFKVPPYTFDLISWIWLVGAVLCLALLVLLLAQQRVALAKARVYALQRGLSVGVVRLDKEDRIVGVNDRAEFLIGSNLPRLGLKTDQSPLYFKAFIDMQKIVVREGNTLRVHPYAKLDALRKEGVSSVYWIRVSQRGRWLKVTGAPVFEPDAPSEEHPTAGPDAPPRKQPTVGLLEPAEHSMIAELERVLNAETAPPRNHEGDSKPADEYADPMRDLIYMK